MSATAAPTTTPKKCGLRFAKSEAPKLQALADRIKIADLTADHSAFTEAAHAAELGEPMIVHFDEIEEVVAMVSAYVLHGIKQPDIEELSG